VDSNCSKLLPHSCKCIYLFLSLCTSRLFSLGWDIKFTQHFHCSLYRIPMSISQSIHFRNWLMAQMLKSLLCYPWDCLQWFSKIALIFLQTSHWLLILILQRFSLEFHFIIMYWLHGSLTYLSLQRAKPIYLHSFLDLSQKLILCHNFTICHLNIN
jgi:hypothetical protein